MRWTIKDEMITSYSISGDGSDAFAFDALAVDQDGADRSGTGGYDHWRMNYGTSATVSGLNPLNASDLALWQENYGATASDDGVHLLGTSDALAPTDFFVV